EDDRRPKRESTRHLAMIGSRPIGERLGNPVRIRDGPAAVRGDAPAPKCHWPPGREGGEGGSPESEDLPPAAQLGPLAEGGFVSRRPLVLAAVLAALVLVPSAYAIGVHVRVEGKTQTIFGSTEPTLSVQANALDALE